MARKTKNSSKANSKATSSTATDIPSSKAGMKNKNKNIESASSSSLTQPLSKQELAILCELNKRNKASMSIIQAQKDKGMSWLPGQDLIMIGSFTHSRYS
jgi:hypothetical protein